MRVFVASRIGPGAIDDQVDLVVDLSLIHI